MKRVVGLGGIFFKAKDNTKMYKWYEKHLGIASESWGGQFKWKDPETGKLSYTAWSIFKEDTEYLNPSSKEMMINYRVENLELLLDVLKKEGVTIIGQPEVSEYGKFGWIMDPEGNKIELWEPPKDESQHITT